MRYWLRTDEFKNHFPIIIFKLFNISVLSTRCSILLLIYKILTEKVEVSFRTFFFFFGFIHFHDFQCLNIRAMITYEKVYLYYLTLMKCANYLASTVLK